METKFILIRDITTLSNGDKHYYPSRGATLTNTLERISCINEKCRWNEMTEKLKVTRQEHVAFVVPNNFCKFFYEKHNQ